MFSKAKKKKPILSISYDQTLLRNVRKKKFPSFKQVRYIKNILTLNEWRVFKVSFTFFIISSLWLTGLGFTQFQTQVPKVGGSYTEAVIGEPQRVNPLFASINPVDQDIASLIFSGLMKYDNDQKLVVDLAESYTVSEDKKTYTFILKKDVKWHDGRPFTANDVLFTFNLIQDAQVNSPLHVSFDGVEVTASDENTINFVLQEPFNPFLASLTVGLIPEHVWQDVDPMRLSLAKQNLQPVGTGPFIFNKLAKDTSGFIYTYQLKRNKDFYNTPPYLEEFNFRFFSEYDGPTGAITALRDQKVDGVSFVPFAFREKITRKYITVQTLRLPQYTALFFNSDHKKNLQDKDVRVALSHAVDKDRIIKHALKGEAQEIASPILKGFLGFDETVKSDVYQPSTSTELLDKKWKRISAEEYKKNREESLIEQWDEQNPKPEVGGPEDEVEETEETATSTEQVAPTEEVVSKEDLLKEYEDLRIDSIKEIQSKLDNEFDVSQTYYRKNDDDEVLALTITTLDTEEYRKAAQTIAGLWREIGIQVTIDYADQQSLKKDIIKNRNYDILLFGVIVGDNPDQYPFWHSSQVDFPGLNLSRYVNRTLDGHLEKSREEIDEEKIKEHYKEIQTILLKEKPAIFLYTPTYTYAIVDKIKGVNIDRLFKPSDRFASVKEWYTKTTFEWNGF